MRRLVVALLAVFTIAGVSACAAEVGGSPRPSQGVLNDAAFLERLEAEGVDVISNPGAIAAGRQVCHDLAEGMRAGYVAYYKGVEGFAPDNAMTVVKAAVEFFCPQYADD